MKYSTISSPIRTNRFFAAPNGTTAKRRWFRNGRLAQTSANSTITSRLPTLQRQRVTNCLQAGRQQRLGIRPSATTARPFSTRIVRLQKSPEIGVVSCGASKYISFTMRR